MWIISKKKKNDTFVHAVVNEVLKKIVRTISSFTRSVDVVVRMGGDKFLLAFQNISEETLGNSLENFRQSVSAISIAECPELKMSVSIGAVYDETSSARISELADKCLYKAKENKNSSLIDKK